MAEKTPVLFATGRLIWGDPYTPETTDMQGNALVVKTGPNMGQARKSWAVGVAIPKGPEAANGPLGWAHTPWGGLIWAAAHAGFPGGAANRPDFAFKVVDGDSTNYNQGKVPKRFCDIPNYAGNWVVKLASGFAPKIVNENGTAEITQEGYVYPGCYVQAFGNCEGNRNDQKPGVYLNLQILSFQAHGERIAVGPDAGTVGFGGGPLPAGASLAPPGGMSLPQAAATGGPMVPQLPGAIALGVPPTPVAAVVVQPNPAFVTLPGAVAPQVAQQVAQGLPQLPGMPTLPAVPQVPVAPQHVMTAKAGGATYEQFRAQNWTDELLRTQGYMV